MPGVHEIDKPIRLKLRKGCSGKSWCRGGRVQNQGELPYEIEVALQVKL
jgi:hypothetical protein